LYTVNCDFEVLHVLSGSVEVRFRDRSHRLEAGDALTFSGGEPHTWTNASTDPAEVVWVLVPAPWSGSA
ncbi:cupin domain-containing protein, partial [Nocardioides sp. GY 10113]